MRSLNNKDIFSCIAIKLDFNTLRNFYLCNKNTYKAVNTLWRKFSHKYPQLQIDELTEIKEERQKNYYIQMGNLENLGKVTKNNTEFLYCMGEYRATCLKTVSLKEFGYLNLKYLSVTKANIKEIPVSITKLRLLEYLDLTDNEIEDFSILCNENSALLNLKELYLYRNHITNIPFNLKDLENLKEIVLHHNRITEVENLWELDHCSIDLTTNHIDTVSLDNIINYHRTDDLSLMLITKNKSRISIDYQLQKEIKVKDNVLYLSDSWLVKPYQSFTSTFKEFLKLFVILCVFARSCI